MEFDLIRKFFSEPFSALSLSNQSRVLLGIGDDCAVLSQSSNQHLYVSTDTCVEGVHFFEGDDPWSIGWKALAVNLSDLAASGAKPIGFTLNLSLPSVDHSWLASFSQGLLKQAEVANCPLVGGDTTATRAGSPVVVTITVLGERPINSNRLTRCAAQAGDDVWVTGIPGLARLGLLHQFAQRAALQSVLDDTKQALFGRVWPALPAQIQEHCLSRLARPGIRSQFAIQASPFMHAALDLSDGLSGDIHHIAKASSKVIILQEASIQSMWTAFLGSGVGALSPDLLAFLLETTLIGGDDYELCFTSAPRHSGRISEIAQSMEIPVTVFGQVQASESLAHGVVIQSTKGLKTALRSNSFNHFGP